MSEARCLLLDVNVLLALAWPVHQFHGQAVARLEQEPQRRWATCALTELGFVRISSNPRVMGTRQTPAQALAVLGALTADAQHVYIEALPPLSRIESLVARIVGHQQVTDAYLLGVAHANRATVLTFDRRMAAITVDERDLEVVA